MRRLKVLLFIFLLIFILSASVEYSLPPQRIALSALPGPHRSVLINWLAVIVDRLVSPSLHTVHTVDRRVSPFLNTVHTVDQRVSPSLHALPLLPTPTSLVQSISETSDSQSVIDNIESISTTVSDEEDTHQYFIINNITWGIHLKCFNYFC